MPRLIKNLDNKKGFLEILTSLRQQRYKSLQQGQSVQDQTWSNSGNKIYNIQKINLTNMPSKIDTQMSLEELNRVICILIKPSSGYSSYWITVSYNNIKQITYEATSTPDTVIHINPQVNIQFGYISKEQITLDSETFTKKDIEDDLFTFLFKKLKNCNTVNKTGIESIEIFDDEKKTTQLYEKINRYTTTTPPGSDSDTPGGKKSLRKKDKRRKKKKTLRRNRKNRKGL